MPDKGGGFLEVTKLEVVYHNAVMAVQGVSFTIPEHGIIGILGANGAGKTTTLRAISGFLGMDHAKVTDGSIKLEGEEIGGQPPYTITKKGIVLVPERDKIVATLSVEENLDAVQPAGTRKITHKTIYDYFPILYDRRHQVAGYLSGGERQMLAISTALLCQPRLLLVDELSLGLSPLLVSNFMGIIRQIREDLGTTIVMNEQNAMSALKIVDYAYIIENGRIVFHGTPQRLMSHEDVKEFYLGLAGAEVKSYTEVKQYRRARRWWG